ncbi:S49 family peptidase [Tamlana sp. s12]|uniref:S49 family peptidase n=1 Tax=Tamlana sp. s12 TaxID=1630406 RepID=UPI0008011D03|nr:S49 family peptidase [Tamlana sp. s12]OBQ56093.1 hypothetical protein VQ01_06830 [Tamlana sp. s12]QQY83394.1 S49 family peptidase [Tamlana sp. s12]
MNFNPVLNDLLRGEWLLDVNWISGAAPLVDSLLKGTPVAQTENVSNNCISFYDSNNNRVPRGVDLPEGSVAVVDMIGAVMKYGGMCSPGAIDVAHELAYANANPNIKAIILRIDGPGGAVSAIGPLLQFAATKTKPVIGLCDAAMSLHYWAAVGVCDYIMADNNISARFGSIGVVSQFVDAKKHWEEKGYTFHEIYPDESKDKNRVFKMALDGDYEKIKNEHLSPMAKKFQAAVRAGRPNLIEEDGVLTGATFDAEKALSLGMIDAIGSFADALRMAHMYAELKTQL